ncbi:ComEA family DNA-binding protein [Arenibacter latericius]|uniref:ComEA family DNA-binding protein n=1 Tax=Arenibacter latericius TaxID=86104 RepID=UPI0003FC12F0|nr:helix-hairpin-helix domain-containing protein [Arenibacter latericius]
MSNRDIKSHFSFNKQERNGIFFLLLIIVALQLLYYLGTTFLYSAIEPQFKVNAELQSEIDQLKINFARQDSIVVYDYNPNFITDYKGYVLGMSPEEIDRLHKFRAKNAFVNSALEFQEVTMISDSLLRAMSPHFKFPTWTQKEKFVSISKTTSSVPQKNTPTAVLGASNASYNIIVKDLNLATAMDLREVVGVGEVLSARIIKFRDRLGGFVVEKQLEHVYGLEKEVVARIWERFQIKKAPNIIKININTASASELVRLVYINYKLANRIVAYREYNGVISSYDQLLDIEDFPSEKLDIIQLYLQL